MKTIQELEFEYRINTLINSAISQVLIDELWVKMEEDFAALEAGLANE